MTYIVVRACWFCNGAIRIGGTPCDTCAGHGRIRITYGTDSAGELTQTVEPQPDAPLPRTPNLDLMKARKAATLQRREAGSPTPPSPSPPEPSAA